MKRVWMDRESSMAWAWVGRGAGGAGVMRRESNRTTPRSVALALYQHSAPCGEAQLVARSIGEISRNRESSLVADSLVARVGPGTKNCLPRLHHEDDGH